LKRAGLGELKRGIYSKTKWGNVRPGWHLECAAISRKYLGAAYDIHVSGADETFPHCENLIAINKACCGHSGAKYWIGAELILVDGRKMSRSLNNIVTMDDLRQSGHGGRDVRFFLLGMNYRKPISYSVSALQMARNTIKKMDTFISRLQTIRNAAPNFPEVDQLIYDLNHAFERALDDDLNISGALAALFEFIGAVNAPLAGGKISGEDARKILEALQKINDVLQVMDFKKPIDDRQIDELIQKREKARQAGLWQEADLLRNRLAGLGVDVLDSRQGTIWRFK